MPGTGLLGRVRLLPLVCLEKAAKASKRYGLSALRRV
jgi:hypothetical protein